MRTLDDQKDLPFTKAVDFFIGSTDMREDRKLLAFLIEQHGVVGCHEPIVVAAYEDGPGIFTNQPPDDARIIHEVARVVAHARLLLIGDALGAWCRPERGGLGPLQRPSGSAEMYRDAGASPRLSPADHVFWFPSSG